MKLFTILVFSLLLSSCVFNERTAEAQSTSPCDVSSDDPGQHYLNPRWQFNDDICALGETGEWDCMTVDAIKRYIFANRKANN